MSNKTGNFDIKEDSDLAKTELKLTVIEFDHLIKANVDDNYVSEQARAQLIIDGFILGEKIGSGGMGDVYKARREGVEGDFAIKLLHSNLTPDEACRRRFEQEAQACNQLTSPNLVTVLGHGVASHGQPYIVMDYIDGETLADLLVREKHLGAGDFINIFLQVCDALIHAHTKNVIHRDLKPSNIMLKSLESGGFTVQVVDFGIARLLSESQNREETLTKTGELLGSPIYMSPEQCVGQPLDERSDIYSLGAVMYECLTGHPPFKDINVVRTILKHINEPVRNFDEVLSHNTIPRDLEDIILCCLEKIPGRRFQSAQELKDSLELIDNNTSELRKNQIKKSYKRKKLYRHLRKNEHLLQVSLTLLFVLAFGINKILDRSAAEQEYENSVDKAQIMDAQNRSAWDPNGALKNYDAVKLWKNALRLAEKLGKPAKDRALLHTKIAQDLPLSYGTKSPAFLSSLSEKEIEYEKALSIYSVYPGSDYASIGILEDLTISLAGDKVVSPQGQYLRIFPRFVSSFDDQNSLDLENKMIDLGISKQNKNEVKEALDCFEKVMNLPKISYIDYATVNYVRLAKEYAFEQSSKNPKLALRFLEKACAESTEPELRITCLRELDNQIVALGLNPRSGSDRMRLAKEAFQTPDGMKAAILEATIANCLDPKNNCYKSDLIAMQTKFVKAGAYGGLRRSLAYTNDLASLYDKFNFWVQKGNSDFIKRRLKAQVASADLEMAYEQVSSIRERLNYEPCTTVFYPGEIALWTGQVEQSYKDFCSMANPFKLDKIKNPDYNQILSVANSYKRLSIYFAFCGDYTKARQSLDLADSILAFHPGDQFDSSTLLSLKRGIH